MVYSFDPAFAKPIFSLMLVMERASTGEAPRRNSKPPRLSNGRRDSSARNSRWKAQLAAAYSLGAADKPCAFTFVRRIINSNETLPDLSTRATRFAAMGVLRACRGEIRLERYFFYAYGYGRECKRCKETRRCAELEEFSEWPISHQLFEHHAFAGGPFGRLRR